MRVVISEFIQGFLIHKIFDKKLYLAAYAFCSKCPSTDDYMPAPSIKLKKKKDLKLVPVQMHLLRWGKLN